MKKHLASIALIAAFVVLPAATFAMGATTDVSGFVTNNKVAVKGAQVVVTCDGHSKTTTSAKNGGYAVEFTAKQCPANSNVVAKATTAKGLSGTNSGPASPVSGTTNLNIATISIAIPEFGTIAGIVAVLIAGGAFLVLRKRNTSSKVA